MRSSPEVFVLVEGQTEQQFVKQLLAPYLAERHVFLTASIFNKPGEKGGDVKFARAKNDIGRHLKQRQDTWVTTLVDYYGIKGDWPGYSESKQQTDHKQRAAIMNQATRNEVQRLFPEQTQGRRFIPYVSMYEIEALYFSDPACVAEMMGVSQERVDTILTECGEPEKINDHPATAPSKRLENLSGRFKKTTTGIALAKKIGIPKMRAACPLFDAWLNELERLGERTNGEAETHYSHLSVL